ncbi:MAG: hypothetical protein HY762_04900 [Planctomycetes bacterium]|nr:hypothetical protein [Planctomycetota bacterium]
MIKPITITSAPGQTIRRLVAERKDVLDDPYRLEAVQESLDRPLEMPGQCDRIDQRWQNARMLSDALQIQIDQLGGRWLISGSNIAECPAGSGINFMRNVELDGIINRSPKEYQPVLKRLLYAIYESQALLEKAFEKLSVEERKYLVKNILPELILDGDKIKDDSQIEAEKVELRLAPVDAKPETHGRDTIDPEQKEGLKLTLKVNYGALYQAGMLVASAVDDAIEMLTTDEHRFTEMNKDIVFSAETPYGLVVIGGIGNNTYNDDAMLIIDLGGDDRYLNRAGGVIGVNRPLTSIVIDLGGNDYYSSERKFSQGSALFGIGILADLGGKDVYQAGHYSQGCGIFGIGMLWDKGIGNDDFSAGIFCQGAGALVDKAGDDYYLSAGTIQNDRPYSMSQGFGQGQRPIASGGIGTLIDSAGNDHYSAYFYAQGCAYWYGLGILIDNAGNDRYDAQVYAQGCGIHLSTGVLIDRSGSDFYNCTYGGNAQGAAHDLAVGILIDKNGRDTYIGCGNNQGSAITNAFALFIDGEGDDLYYTTPKGGQGWGGAARGYGSIGLFIDEGGNDFYSEEYLNPDSGTGNSRKWINGDKGVGIDTETTDEHR